MANCCVCGEELYDYEDAYCEDCRDSGDLEEVLESILNQDTFDEAIAKEKKE